MEWRWRGNTIVHWGVFIGRGELVGKLEAMDKEGREGISSIVEQR